MKTVLITGANRGIGLEIARQLVRRSFHVIAGVRSPGDAAKTLEFLQPLGHVSALQLDVSQSTSIRRAATEFESIGTLDVLINNAGIYPDEGISLLTLSRNQCVDTFQTNTFGPLEVTQAFLPFLKKARESRVINMSSGYGQLEGLTPYVPSYCLSKLALNGLTIMLAQELAPHGIAVNSMSPGWVRTDMGGPDATRSVEEGAETAVWLATEADHQLTGKFFRDRSEIPW